MGNHAKLAVGLDDENLHEMRLQLEQARQNPSQALVLAGEFLELASRMAAKATKLARIGDRTQARLVELYDSLRQQEERYRGIFENSTEGIFLADAQGRLMAVNPSLQGMLELPEATRESGCGQMLPSTTVASLFYDAAESRKFLCELAANKRVRRMEARLAAPRHPLWCLFGAARIEPDGYVVGMILDISAQKSLEEELLRLAGSDFLTGLANRRDFFAQTERAMAAARRTGAALALTMLDVDHFKSVNDGYGHDAGDAVLRALADTLRGGVRASDLVGRIGGEEFAVLSPGSDLAGGAELAERLRRAVEALEIVAGGGRLRVTASFGVAELRPGSDASPSCFLSRADHALYGAKRDGRNRVRLAPDPDTDLRPNAPSELRAE